MKIYKFYIKRKNCPDIYVWKQRGNPDDYILYAFTTKKELAKKFEKDRNMKLFVKKIQEDADKEELNYIKNSHRLAELILYDLVYFEHGTGDKKREASYKEVLCVSSEREILDTRLESSLVSEFNYINPAIFTKKTGESLKVLQYIAAYKLWLQMCDSLYLTQMVNLLKSKYDDDYESPMIAYDEVQIFIEYFGCLY